MEELQKFIVEYGDLAKQHAKEQKDLVEKHTVSAKSLEEPYEDLANRYADLEIQYKDTENKRDDLNNKYEDLNRKYAELVEKNLVLVEKHEHLVKQLQDKVECPVCLVVPNKAPIPICPNGHVVCTKCVREDCPKCRVKMGQGTSTLAVTVIENLDHQCENEGCLETFPFEELASHGKCCNHRLVPCPDLINCDEMVSISSLASHLVSCGCLVGDQIGVYKLPQKFNFYVDKVGETEELWPLHAMKFGKHIFMLKVARYNINNNWKWFFMVQMDGGAEATSGYGVTLIVYRTEDGQEGKYSQRYSGDVCPIDVTTLDSADEKGLCLSLSDGAMEKVIDKDIGAERSFSVTVDLFGGDPTLD